MTAFEPAYRQALREGKLKELKTRALDLLKHCSICPRRCGVNRLRGELGLCRTPHEALVSSASPHFGEEDPLVGECGSGTIFFTYCSLGCNFCQNFSISHQGEGRQVSDRALADIMLSLERQGCHNINFVTPSHVVPQILAALEIAAEDGLAVPLVYNTSGYDSRETLRLLEGIIDIYMPDFKFWDRAVAEMTCNAPDYPETARAALREMHRQVGDLVTNQEGVAQRGLLIRHLVLPGGLAGTRAVMRFIAREISKDSYVNIMPQYRPSGRAHEVESLSQLLPRDDYNAALAAAEEEGITRLDRR